MLCIFEVSQCRQRTERSENASSGRLQGVKNNAKSSTVRPKRSRSLTWGGRSLEVPTLRLWLGKFRCFGLAVVYGRWSLTKGGRTWRFDCINSGGSRPSDKGGGGGHSDPEIRRGRRQNVFPPFGPQFGLKIRGGWAPRAPSLDPPLIPVSFPGFSPTLPERTWERGCTDSWFTIHNILLLLKFFVSSNTTTTTATFLFFFNMQNKQWILFLI